MVGEILLHFMKVAVELVVGMVDKTNCICKPWIGNRVEEVKIVGSFRMAFAKPVEIIHVTIPLAHILILGEVTTRTAVSQISQSFFRFHPKGPHMSVLISLGVERSVCSAPVTATAVFKLANEVPTRAIAYKV